MRHVLVGGGGILGSALAEVVTAQGADLRRVQPTWTSPAAVEQSLGAELPRHVVPDGTVLLWAAGVGHVGASAASLEAETRGLRALASAVRSLPDAHAAGLTVVFASSAGALFGGHGSAVVDEGTPPSPISAYGEEKLVQERLLEQLAQQTGCRVVACRISNLFGLAQGRLSARGLVSTAVRCTRLRQPMTVFVSPDTRRDYVYSRDAAALALHLGRTAPAGFSTALLRDGRSRTVAQVLALVGSVVRRRVPATYAERPETRLQPRVLRFAPPAQPSPVRLTPMPAAVHLMARAPVAPLPRAATVGAPATVGSPAGPAGDG